ncbi:MBL fold metallo-hydrolase [Candidatus Mycoplasma mahonii]|uniref:MBL fold metallo-hydrolase n=1 Tax=Candidatus Mycoplasma mahonii TaxID=3004105 RepID=UPI0026F3251D|nr:MBL fold metallo-hydrolase [Candidatus Mycoplasma mahonii]WKX02597.1 MBL fold metallo-hydrolase [Candidatus Mycoplasma mahonii]
MKIIKSLIYDQRTYILEIDGKLVIIDPGYNDKEIIKYLGEQKPDLLLLTHFHFDHMACADILCEKYDIKSYISRRDYDLLLNNHLASRMGYTDVTIKKKYIKLFDNKIDALPNLEIINAPGHSDGSVLFKYENMIFTGDVLFTNSYGRTDLIGSDPKKQLESIAAFKNYDSNLHVYPGHGNNDKLANIIKNNDFFKEM